MISFALQSMHVTADGSELIRRSAMCPEHDIQSSNFLGVTAEGWSFRCKRGHLFTATPDPHAPKTQEEVERWLRRERQKRLS